MLRLFSQVPGRDLGNLICLPLMILLCFWSMARRSAVVFALLNSISLTYFAVDTMLIYQRLKPSTGKKVLLLHHILTFFQILTLWFNLHYRLYFFMGMSTEINGYFLILRRNVKSHWVELAFSWSWYVFRLGANIVLFLIFIPKLLYDRQNLDWLLWVIQFGLLCVHFYWHSKIFLLNNSRLTE